MELGPDPLPGPFPSMAIRGLIALRSRLRALLDAAGPPELAMIERMTGASSTMLVGTVAKLGIPDLLAARGALSPAQIAESLDANPDAVHRVMRALALTGIFTRGDDGRYENNRLSTTLRSGQPSRARDFAIYYASASNMRAWVELEHVVRTGKNGFEHAHGKSVWEWFDDHVHERETFAHAMMGMTMMEAPSIATLYPFAEIGSVCDVGGGRGTLLSEILIRHPHLRGILCDSNGVLDSARSLLAGRGVAHRVELAPGSFFDRVPEGADAYLLKHILHDWDDARSLTILRTIRRAAKPGRRVLVCEALVEKDTDDGIGALADVQMMVVCCEGRERGRAELGALFAQSGFELGRVLEGATVSVVEGIAR